MALLSVGVNQALASNTRLGAGCGFTRSAPGWGCSLRHSREIPGWGLPQPYTLQRRYSQRTASGGPSHSKPGLVRPIGHGDKYLRDGRYSDPEVPLAKVNFWMKRWVSGIGAFKGDLKNSQHFFWPPKHVEMAVPPVLSLSVTWQNAMAYRNPSGRQWSWKWAGMSTAA